MICPLVGSDRDCCESECAWWDGRSGLCSIAIIARGFVWLFSNLDKFKELKQED